jgi:PAS domain S-box-containing protein
MTTPGAPPNRYMAALQAVFSKLPECDSSSETGARLFLGRLIADVCDALSISGMGLFTSAGKGLQTIAKHGLAPEAIVAIVERVKSVPALAGRGPDDAGGREHGPAPVDPPAARGRFTFHADGGGVQTVIRAGFGAGQVVLAVFVTGDEPAEDLAEAFGLVTTHVARFAANVYLHQQVLASTGSIAKMERELREMQVCSLNIMEDLQRKNRDLAMLNSLFQEITGRTSRPELARVAAEAISGAFDGACVSIYVADTAASAFVPYHTTGSAATIDGDGLAVEPDSPLLGPLSRGKEIAFNSATEQPSFPLAKAVGAKAGLLVPLRAKDATIGFLAVCESRWHRVFTDDERDNLRVLAGTLSVAMENANLIAHSAAQVEELNSLTEYVETVVDSVDLAILVVGADLKIGMINKGFDRIYGEPGEQFVGRGIFEAFPYLVNEGFEDVAKQVLGGTPFVRFGMRRQVLGGRQAVQNLRVFPHRASGGNIVGAIIIIEDITEKADLEMQLAKSEAKFRTLVENLGDGYLIVTGGRVAYANKAASQMTGLPPDQLQGMEVSQLLSDADVVEQCLHPGSEKASREARLIHATGTWIAVEITSDACDYAGDQSVSIAIRDVTERKKFERQLEQKNREMSGRNEQITRLNLELEGAVTKLKESQENLIKSERLAAITETSVAANHEINNPLFSILGQAQLLLRKYANADEETVNRLKTIEESALRIACVTRKLANLAQPVVKEYAGLDTSMIDVDGSTAR